jgi:hypothetical protein
MQPIVKCDKKVFVKTLQKYKPCVRESTHNGCCSADFTGETFGFLKVIKLAKIKNSINIYWVVKQGGLLRTVRAKRLMSGHTKGANCLGGFSRKNGQMCPEYATVLNHFWYITDPTCANYKNYKGMPFFDGWNPKKGGSYHAGAKWIIKNLGKKPSFRWSIDIIKHELGFVPGNIRWAKRDTQLENQRHRVLGKFSIEEFRVEARCRGYKLVRL